MFEFLFDQSRLFFDVSLAEQIFRLILATMLGAILGFERELKNKPAGFITFMFVSLGACLFSLLQLNLAHMLYNAIQENGEIKEYMSVDAGRIIAQVVSGIGFLGAGTIIFNKGNVKGITTAAMLWVAAALGLLIGMGGEANYLVAFVTAVVLLPLMLSSRRIGRKISNRFKEHRVFIAFEEQYELDLFALLKASGASVKKTFFHNKYQSNGIHYKEVYFYFTVDKETTFDEVVRALSQNNWILSLEDM
ncbi:MAG: MgtC/SapB family protein [Bacilli bacterium]|jgi:putative Mg2+ transporter-C (MgtC) family protein|nr:MgtC/SapB family protein [Bacilli bacterium]